MTLDGLEILTTMPDFAQRPKRTLTRGNSLVALGQARRVIAYTGERVIHSMTHEYVLQTKAEIEAFLDFFNRMAGKWGGFLLPSWHGELSPAAGILPGATLLQIDPVEYPTRFLNGYQPLGQYVWLFGDNGASHVSKVTGAVAGVPEVLTLEDAPTVEFRVGHYLVGFLYPVRFVEDSLEFAFSGPDKATVKVTFIEAFGATASYDENHYFIDGTAIEVDGTDTMFHSSFADIGGWTWDADGGPFLPTCGRVTFTPPSRGAAVPCSIALSAPTTCEGDPAIHYTLDGTTPTSASPVYSAALALTANTTIKAIALKTGLYDGPVSTAVYTDVIGLEAPLVPADPIDFSDNTNVEIIPTPDTNVRYTDDGTTPDADSPLIDGPIPITDDTVVKVITEKDGEISDPAVITFVKADPIFIPSFIGWTGNQFHIRLAATIPAGGFPVTAILIFPITAVYSRGAPILVEGGGPVPIYQAGVQYLTGYGWNQNEGWGTINTLSIGGTWFGDWDTYRWYWPRLLTVDVAGVPVNTGYLANLTTLPEGTYDIDLYGSAQLIQYTTWRGIIVYPPVTPGGTPRQIRFDLLPA